MVARAAAKSNRATPEAADATAMVSGSMCSGVAMVGRWAGMYCSSWVVEEEQLADMYCRRAAGLA
jgi:hypothetical protein